MGAIWVVRHGQASFLAENYDRLSPLGERQARLLAEHWLKEGVSFQQVYAGPAERQIRTGEIIGGVYRQAGQPWPEATVDPDLDEFPAETVVRRFLPELMSRHAHLAASVAEFQAATEYLPKQRLFDRVLREVSQRWMLGEVDAADIPSWRDFCHRVEAAVGRIRAAAPRSSRVAVFTSGGPTAATARVALGLSYEATLELTWSPRNASVSEFLFTGERFSLSTFNSTAHLPEASLLTYR
jgi:broad specificity phosphatase PhoE